ncbi:caskin-2-like [Notolabrus celidotus]|uniref:caskin-2-like n=1 Tax=Notolabrus celidotus TaxID=1203425 RepID=UPI00148FADB1|nr:caskin-2-like [Notolabrus celidotus]
MQRIYMHSNEHFEVFTTVLAPQGEFRYIAEAEKMVAVHRYSPQWPDELELTLGDVVLVLSKHQEGRWFGRLQDGQRGWFPASCVMELSQVNLPPKALQRSVSLRGSSYDNDARCRQGNGHILQALKRGSRGGAGGGGGGLDRGQGQSEGPFLVRRPQNSMSHVAVASEPQMQRSPNLLHRILSKYRKKSECQGATNGAFEGD